MIKRFSKVLRESSLGRIYQHTRNRNIGMISASRGDLPAMENGKRHAALAKDIRKLGYGFIRTEGRYTENFGKPDARHVDEKAFLVIGKKGSDHGGLLGHLKNLGTKYGQDSVLHKAHDSTTAALHVTNENGYLGKGKSVDIGSWHPNRIGEFYSLMKNKTFRFGEEFIFVKEKSFFNRAERLY
jgi:hypothetical protein